jgi:hypothetical protein
MIHQEEHDTSRRTCNVRIRKWDVERNVHGLMNGDEKYIMISDLKQ